jgi:circadian clock protein KaiC
MMIGAEPKKVDSGTPGLDAVLHGGFLSGHAAIVTGGPGTGKTIIALQFLAAADGDSLYIGFEEREQELRRNAARLGIDLSDVSILDLSAEGDRFFTDEGYTLFSSEEVEGEQLLKRIASAIEDHDVDRLVVDPLSELRSLLPDDFQFRRNISSLFNTLNDRGITTLCTAQPSDREAEADLQFLGNTTIEIHRSTDRRSVEVTKYRGSETESGRHTFRIHSGSGGRVYPKLVPGDHHRETTREPLPSDVDALDALLDGGIERGSVTIISGPSGVGKTTTGTHFLQAAAKRDERALAFLFEELRSDYLYRATQLGMDVEGLVEAETFEIEEIEALTQSPDEFAHHVRTAVEERDVEFVMIDGIAGYRLGLRGADSQEQLTREIHALCRYLKRMGVTVILIEEIGAITGEFSATNTQTSYIADNIVFLQYLEVDGDIEKAIGVLKKRFGGFEQSLRELRIDTGGLHVGERLSGYHGILTGTPEPAGEQQ